MIKVFYETPNNSYAEHVATFKDEEMYAVCLPSMESHAKSINMIVTESVEESDDVSL